MSVSSLIYIFVIFFIYFIIFYLILVDFSLLAQTIEYDDAVFLFHRCAADSLGSSSPAVSALFTPEVWREREGRILRRERGWRVEMQREDKWGCHNSNTNFISSALELQSTRRLPIHDRCCDNQTRCLYHTFLTPPLSPRPLHHPLLYFTYYYRLTV